MVLVDIIILPLILVLSCIIKNQQRKPIIKPILTNITLLSYIPNVAEYFLYITFKQSFGCIELENGFEKSRHLSQLKLFV